MFLQSYTNAGDQSKNSLEIYYSGHLAMEQKWVGDPATTYIDQLYYCNFLSQA